MGVRSKILALTQLSIPFRSFMIDGGAHIGIVKRSPRAERLQKKAANEAAQRQKIAVVYYCVIRLQQIYHR